jgi:hypothetical protein
MDVTFCIKRRSADGEPGPPQSLAASELAYNEAEDVLYYGKGDDNGQAVEIVAIGGAALPVEIKALWVEIRQLKETIEKLRNDIGV